MNKNSRKMTTRERRERYRRSMSLTHLLIAIVALIECFMLITFTTYSWIESSSSLKIASGPNGSHVMSIARALNYSVNIAPDSSAKIDLNESAQGSAREYNGYYRTVQNFSYARTSSPDGKTFYFPANNNNLSGANVVYRKGDTADYNTAYTYIDFEIRNTAEAERIFYFDYPSAGMFTYASGSASSAVQDYILGAMRMSVQKNEDTPIVFSINDENTVTSGSSNSPFNNEAGARVSSLTVKNIDDYKFPDDDSEDAIPVFTSDGTGDGIDRVSIRVWFEMTDPTYVANKAAVDAVLSGSVIGLNFTLAFTNVDYAPLYFDDFAFSNYKTDGTHLTKEAEDEGYAMYMHVFNTKEGKWINYRMGEEETDNGAVRWNVTLPVPYVIQELTSAATDASHFSGAYFFYGRAKYGIAEPIVKAYQWNLSSLSSQLATETYYVEDDEEPHLQLTEATRYVRNLGVVKASSTTEYNDTVTGWLQYSNDASGAMTLLTVRDRSTGFTGDDYNLANNGAEPYQFITASRGSSREIPLTYATNDLYYADISAVTIGNNTYTPNLMVFYTGSGGGGNQTTNVDINYHWTNFGNFPDVSVFYLLNTTGSNGNRNWQRYGHSAEDPLPDAFSNLEGSGEEGFKRVYFHNNLSGANWSNVRLYVGYDTSAEGLPYKDFQNSDSNNMTPYVGGTNSTLNFYKPVLFINRYATGGTAGRTISFGYNSEDDVYTAYVPSTWTASGSYIHYNPAGYYHDSTDDPNDHSIDKLRFNLGAFPAADGSSVYTILGYNTFNTIGSLSPATDTGVGVWTDVREVSFSTELIDTKIFGSNRYVLSYSTNNGSSYTGVAMAPVDDLGLTYKAWLPVSSATSGYARFERYELVESEYTKTGTWTTGAIGDSDQTYYAVDPTGADNSNPRGYFHVAVLTDATYENLVYDLTLDSNDHVDGSSLRYSFDIQNINNVICSYTVSNDEGTTVDNYRAGDSTRRWIIPITDSSNTVIYYKWTPYPGTEFVYEHDLSMGMYYSIAEGYTDPATIEIIVPTEAPTEEPPEEP